MNVVIYHGTTCALINKIKSDERLSPKKGNTHVYVTTDLEVAKTYARAWTAWALENSDEIESITGFKPEPKGLIIKTIIRDEFLIDDTYNTEGEPNPID